MDSVCDARRSAGLLLLSDFANLRPAEEYGLPSQAYPKTLEWDGESPTNYRERLHFAYRMPVVLGALNDLKYPYVEVVSPFLSRSLVQEVNALPDALRVNKRLHKQIVASDGPAIPFATHSAVASRRAILKSSRVATLLMDELNSQAARALLPHALLSEITTNLVIDDALSRTRNKWQLLSYRIANRLRQSLTTKNSQVLLDYNVLALRAYIIYKMHNLLMDDARASTRS